MPDYTQNAPSYIGIQWDGTNQQDLVDLMLTWAPNVNGTSIDSFGGLSIDAGVHAVYIPADGYLVSGPRWTGVPEAAPIEALDEPAFTARFSPVPPSE